MQATVAEKLRRGRGGADPIDEGKVWHHLEKHLAEKSVSQDDIAAQISRLHWFRGGEEPRNHLAADFGFDEKVVPPESLLKEQIPAGEMPVLPGDRYSDLLPEDLRAAPLFGRLSLGAWAALRGFPDLRAPPRHGPVQ